MGTRVTFVCFSTSYQPRACGDVHKTTVTAGISAPPAGRRSTVSQQSRTVLIFVVLFWLHYYSASNLVQRFWVVFCYYLWCNSSRGFQHCLVRFFFVDFARTRSRRELGLEAFGWCRGWALPWAHPCERRRPRMEKKKISPSSVILFPVKLWELLPNVHMESRLKSWICELLPRLCLRSAAHSFWCNCASHLKKLWNEAMLLWGLFVCVCVWRADQHYLTSVHEAVVDLWLHIIKSEKRESHFKGTLVQYVN